MAFVENNQISTCEGIPFDLYGQSQWKRTFPTNAYNYLASTNILRSFYWSNRPQRGNNSMACNTQWIWMPRNQEVSSLRTRHSDPNWTILPVHRSSVQSICGKMRYRHCTTQPSGIENGLLAHILTVYRGTWIHSIVVHLWFAATTFRFQHSNSKLCFWGKSPKFFALTTEDG